MVRTRNLIVSMFLSSLAAASCLTAVFHGLKAGGESDRSAVDLPVEIAASIPELPEHAGLLELEPAAPAAAATTAAATTANPVHQPDGLAALLRQAQPEEAYQTLLGLTLDADAAARQAAGLQEVAQAARFDPELRGLAILALARAGDLSPAEHALGTDHPRALRQTAREVLRLHGRGEESRLP